MTKCPHCGTSLRLVQSNAIGIIDDGLIFDTSKFDAMESVKRIIIHHSASSSAWTIQDIHELHQSGNKWAGIGYHYVIHYDGSIHKGRPDDIAGAHCIGQNSSSLGICVIGNFEVSQPSRKQVKSLDALVKSLGIKEVKRHNEYSNTLCPGRLMRIPSAE